MRAALYIRVSKEIQAEEGYSLDSQLQRLHAFCDSQAWEVASVFVEEGQSGKDTDRPQLQRLMAAVQAGICDVVLVWRLDRLTRSVTDLHKLLEFFGTHNVAFRSATEVFDTTSAVGRLFLTIVAAMAQWERENLGERTKAGQIEMTRQGKWSGGRAAFGYRHENGQLYVHEAEAAVVREAFQRYISGQGMSTLLRWLNDPASPQLAPRSGRWAQHTLKSMLRNPLYAGMVRYGYRDVSGHRRADPLIAPGQHEAIIDTATWERSEAVRMRRRTMPNRSGTGTYPFTGLLKCGLCGSSMYGRTTVNKTKAGQTEHRHYMCVERMHTRLCEMPMVREDLLDNMVMAEIARWRDDIIQMDMDVSEQNKSASHTEKLERDMRKVENRRQRFMDAYADGNMTSAELRGQLDKIQIEMDRITDAIRASELPQEAVINAEAMKDILTAFPTAWQAADAPERRELLRLIIKQITVMPGPQIQVAYMV